MLPGPTLPNLPFLPHTHVQWNKVRITTINIPIKNREEGGAHCITTLGLLIRERGKSLDSTVRRGCVAQGY
jgi:hypothetical protein